jgi:RND family efflux transporter MFP subunit
VLQVATLKDDLASLRIDQSARASGGRRGVWILLLIVIAAIAAGGWFWTKAADAAIVRTVTVAARTSTSGPSAGAVLNAAGYVTARRRATVSSKVTGKVLEVFVEEGRSVRRGDVLARLDDSQVRASLAIAEAQLGAARRGAAEDEAHLREAELTLQRREQLIKEQVIGKAELDSARAQVESLRARIEMAQQQIRVAEAQVHQQQTDLADMVVRAPFDGVAVSKDAQPGEMISPISAGGGFTRTGICTLVDMTSLEIEVDVSENYINRVHPAQPIEAVLDAYPDWKIPGHVITTVPTADRQKATVRVRIGFAALDPRILPDMGVKVSFLNEAQAVPPAAAATPRARIFVPKAAVRSMDGHSVVFIVRGDHVERRAVTVGAADGDQVEVQSGLADGEQIVVDGPPTLVDGARITVKER